MIYDHIENLKKYDKMLQRWSNYVEFISQSAEKAVGKYELPDGDFVLIQEGTTKPVSEGQFEAHKKFIDLQVVATGSEFIKWQVLPNLTETVPYNEQKDKVNFSGDGTPLEIKANHFYLMLPSDGHMACVHFDQPTNFRKYVIKIKI
jgi:YhcH/YjgK/YiaL family protein